MFLLVRFKRRSEVSNRCFQQSRSAVACFGCNLNAGADLVFFYGRGGEGLGG